MAAVSLLAFFQPVTARAAEGQDEPPTVQFARSSAVVVESAQRITISVAVSAPLSRDAQVTMSIRGGTATVGEDVVLDADPVALTFAADEMQSQSVALTLNDDEQREGIEFIDLVLQSDDVPAGPARSFRLWIRDDVLYPDQIAGALTTQLQSDFKPSTVLGADAAADSLLGVIWNEEGTVDGTFTRSTVTVSGEGRPADLAQEQGIVAGHVWPVSRNEKDRAKRDLHLLVPVHEDVQERRRAALTRASDEPVDADALSSLQPHEELRGDMARAILYYHAMYPEQARPEALASLKSTLAQWMDDDPVDDRELRRNTAIARHQGRPNPFVLAPELAESAFNLRDTYPTPTVSFAQRGASVVESDSVAVLDVVMNGMGDEEVTLTVALDASASTVDVEDLGGFRYRTVRFPAGAPDGTVRRVRVPVAHDEIDEDMERALFALRNASGFTRTGEVAQYALDIENARQPTEEDEGRIVLGPAYPNPLSPGRGSTVQFEVSMEEAMPFSVEVFSTLGQRVRAQRYSAGEAARLSVIEINAQDLPSGLYIVRLRGPSVNITETFVIVR